MNQIKVNMFCIAILAAMSSTLDADLTIFEHSGSNDPTTEGWSIGGSGGIGVSVGPVFNDAGSGLDAWMVDDNSAVLGSNLSYFQTLSPNQNARAVTNGWSYSVTLRITDVLETDNASPFVNYVDGSTDWRMHFGSEADGDPFILLWDGGGTFNNLTGPKYTLQGVGNTYHTYELVYDPVAGSADLYVDGVEQISNYTGFAVTGAAGFSWGSGSSADMGQGNFNHVAFTVVPEPSAMFGLLLISLHSLGSSRRRSK